MRITDFNLARTATGNRISAMVRWEDCGEPDREVFIETPGPVDLAMDSCPHAFLVGSLVPALHFGEGRIAMDADICPGLLEGLELVMHIMGHWSGGAMVPLRIESGRRAVPTAKASMGRSGMPFSGGIDSLAALRLNRLRYPRTHPGYVRDCLFIHGFDIGGVKDRGAKYTVYDRALEAMERVMAETGAQAIPVYTNLRHLCDQRELWVGRFFGAVLASIAHAFSHRLDLFYIASSYDFANLEPCGSHPILDPEYSSFELRVRHRDLDLGRFDKLRIVSEWDTGLQNLRVCLANVPDRLNCGRCEKCVRTMTGLVALDALHKTRAFSENDVTPGMFEGFKLTIRHREPYYLEMLPALRERGRDDLARTIEKKLGE